MPKRLSYYIDPGRISVDPLYVKQLLNKLLAGRISCYYITKKLRGRRNGGCTIIIADVVIGSRYTFDRRLLKTTNSILITVKMSAEMLERLDEVARKYGISRSALIKLAVMEFLKKLEK